MNEPRFGRFEPPANLTELEWAALDTLRSGGGLRDAAAHLGIAEKQLRVVIKNAAEKLRLAASV
jgi:hypothetical protein